MNPLHAALLAVTSAAAGLINSIAGGGSLVTFPAELAVGLSPLIANATNSVALSPGAFAAAYAYRREIGRDRGIVRRLLPVSIAGSIVGAVLLLVTPAKIFDTIVPALVLFATLLLLAPKRKKKGPAVPDADAVWELPGSPAVVMGLQFLISVYGGYFGAGAGIMMLAVYGAMGAPNIHRMNGVKTVMAATLNAVAALIFVFSGKVDYHAAAVMAVCSSAGGLFGGTLARRIRPEIVRYAVVAIGLGLSFQLAYHRFHG